MVEKSLAYSAHSGILVVALVPRTVRRRGWSFWRGRDNQSGLSLVVFRVSGALRMPERTPILLEDRHDVTMRFARRDSLCDFSLPVRRGPERLADRMYVANNHLIVVKKSDSNTYLAYSGLSGEWRSHAFPEGVEGATCSGGGSVCVQSFGQRDQGDRCGGQGGRMVRVPPTPAPRTRTARRSLRVRWRSV